MRLYPTGKGYGMNRILPWAVTAGLACLILGAGYVGIRESGERVLESGSAPEELDYANTESNVFHGKIDEDVELFPWNYYSRRDDGTAVPFFLEKARAVTGGEEETGAGADECFMQMIAYESGVGLGDVRDFYRGQDEGGIVGNMAVVESSVYGPLYFYEETLSLSGEKYRVRISCDDWGVISFTCVERGHGGKGIRESWEEVENEMVEALGRRDGVMEEFFLYMVGLKEISLLGLSRVEMGSASVSFEEMPLYYEMRRNLSSIRVNAYLQGMTWADGLLSGEPPGEGAAAFETRERQDAEVFGQTGEGSVAFGLGTGAEAGDGEILAQESGREAVRLIESYGSGIMDEEGDVDESSCQIIEMSDMILLLVQRDIVTVGAYYDPISRKFCGFHYFYE